MCIVRNGKEGHNKCHKIDRKIEVDPIKIRRSSMHLRTFEATQNKNKNNDNNSSLLLEN